VLEESPDGALSGTWSGSVRVSGRRTGPATLELSGRTRARAYSVRGRLEGATLVLEYDVERLDARGRNRGRSVFDERR
jgi:hypothetical protein